MPREHFRPIFTEEADATYRSLAAAALVLRQNRQEKTKAKANNAERLFKQVEKCVRLLLENLKHLGLSTHGCGFIEHPCDPKKKVVEGCVRSQFRGRVGCFGGAARARMRPRCLPSRRTPDALQQRHRIHIHRRTSITDQQPCRPRCLQDALDLASGCGGEFDGDAVVVIDA